MASGDTKTEALLNILGNGGDASAYQGCCNTKAQNYILDAIDRVQAVEDEVERLENNPDVVDIVATYADLVAYDTSGLTDKDVIRVLQDETHNGDSTYYRWDATAQEWSYIGESKQYTDFVGTDGTAAGEAGLVPAPATTDAGKFLKADGTWDDAGSTINVVQTTGTSTTDVMSQNATTSMVFADPDQQAKVKIGASTSISGNALQAIVIGTNSYVNKTCGEALGANTAVTAINGVAFSHGKATVQGEFNIGTANNWSTGGYNGTAYRLLTGVHDPVDDHDAATKGYVDTAVAGGGGGVTPVQTIGTSTTDVMSQKATTDMIYSDKTTSSYNSGGAVYIGCLNANQERMPDPTTIDLMDKYFWALPGLANSVPSSKSVNIMGMQAANYSVAIGQDANIPSIGQYGVAVGYGATSRGNGSVAIGRSSYVNNNINHSVALGENASPTRNGEVNIGTGSQSVGYNSTSYRVIGGVHDGQLAQDAVTVNQVNSVIDAINTALSTSIPHIGA